MHSDQDAIAAANNFLYFVKTHINKLDAAKDCVLCSHNRSSRELISYPFTAPRCDHTVTIRILKCSECGLVYLDDHMSVAEEAEMYRLLGKLKSWRSSEEYSGICDESAMLRDKAAIVKSYLPKSNGGELLDLGSASGDLLNLLRDTDWGLHGVDISADLVDKGKERFGLDLMAGTLEQVQLESGSLNCVTAFDLIEHLTDPVATLKEINRILKKGGLLILEVPNEDTSFRMVARFLCKLSLGRINWPIQRLYYLGHLYYLNKATLEIALKKTGFSILDVYAKESYNTRYGYGKHGKLKGIINVAIDLLNGFDKIRNTGAKLVVCARKE